MDEHYIKIYDTYKERHKYYDQVDKIAFKIMVNPITIDRFIVLEKVEEYSIVKDIKYGIRLFVKFDPGQDIDILKSMMMWMTKTNSWLYIYTIGIVRSHNMIIYDYYENDIYHMFTKYHQEPNFVISVIQRVLLAIYHLNKLGITHNDLHLRNILYNETEMTEPLIVSTDIGNYTFNNNNYEVVLGDFGMSYSGKNLKKIEEFYKTYFPILYFSNKNIYNITDYTYIDIWRFLQTLITVLCQNPELYILSELLKIQLTTVEIRLVSVPLKGETVCQFCLKLIELLYLELDRLSF